MAPQYGSPQSSSEGSLGGTPDTRITAFSPEDVRYGRQPLHRTTVTPSSSTSNDPFVSASTTQKPKLSALASEFEPSKPRVLVPVPDARPLPGTAEHLNNIISAAENESAAHELGSYGTFTTSTVRTRILKITSLRGVSLDVMSTVDSALHNIVYQGSRRVAGAGNAVLLRLSHIEDVPLVYNALQATGQLAVEYISPAVFQMVVSPSPGTQYSAYEGQVVLRISYAANVRNLPKAEFEKHLLRLLCDEGKVTAYKKVVDAQNLVLIAEFADATHATKAIAKINGMTIGGGMYTISLATYQPDLVGGTMQRVHNQNPTATPTRRPGGDLSGVMSSLSLGTGALGPIESLRTAQGTPNLSMVQANGFGHTQLAPNFGMYPPANGLQPYFLPPGSTMQLAAYPPYVTYAVDPSYLALQPALRPFGHLSPDRYGSRSLVRRQNAVKIPNSRHRGHHNNAHNTVVIDRIKNGSDVRTTVMLRNIPNKMDQIGLKSIVDESSFGHYDFMYLRIDFSNNCNVGYAFLNFVDPIDILKFVEARAGNTWPGYRSDKVAEVSYATIQGKDCLVQKFRNSSVMLEPPTHRPKLFVTYHDIPAAKMEDIGKEEVFPASDNPAKLKRSCENAEHVGLFAPSAGQHMRDEQRRRRSQFDRGTSLAEREEYDDEYDPYLDY